MRKFLFLISIFFLHVVNVGAVPNPEELVSWAHSNGLTRYSTVSEFRYDAPISRQEASAILVRATLGIFHKTDVNTPCSIQYRDERGFDLTLKNEIYRACSLGIMKGANGYFMPKYPIARDQTLATLIRAVDGGVKDESGPIWYQAYADRAFELGLTFANMKGMNEPITRGELIEWMYVIASNLPLPVSPTALSNTSWRLESFNTNAVSGSYILTFDAGDSLSTRFCNQMGGKYTLRNMVFQDVHLFSTLMYCDGEGNPLESAFRLEGASALVTGTGDTLQIVTLTRDTYIWKKL